MSESTRRLEREKVLTLLYEADMKGTPIDEVIENQALAPEPFVADTVRGVTAAAADVDAAINRHAISWSTDRMAAIDRLVLRIGAYELMRSPDVPVAVVISEAVELAKRFSTEESGKFVNGILSAIADEVRTAS